MGYTIEASHHEVAEGQHEIDFKFDEVMTSADRVMTFKHVVKTYATKHGLHATFMPKPIYGINGSGMHTNMSLMTKMLRAKQLMLSMILKAKTVSAMLLITLSADFLSTLKVLPLIQTRL